MKKKEIDKTLCGFWGISGEKMKKKENRIL